MKSLLNNDKPVVMPQREVKHPCMNKVIGEIGWEKERGETVFVTKRSRESSLYRNTPDDKNGGYAISESVLSELRASGVERIYVGEYETEDVYQFGREQFHNGMRLTHHPKDSQRCVSIDDRQQGYPNYLEDLVEGDKK